MSNTTALLGPYDNLPAHEKTNLSACIPVDVKHRLFQIFLSRRGSIDKVLCRCINMIDAYISEHAFLYEHDEHTREAIINNILNEFVIVLQNLDPRKTLPVDPFAHIQPDHIQPVTSQIL
jgi:hypothetical protein